MNKAHQNKIIIITLISFNILILTYFTFQMQNEVELRKDFKDEVTHNILFKFDQQNIAMIESLKIAHKQMKGLETIINNNSFKTGQDIEVLEKFIKQNRDSIDNLRIYLDLTLKKKGRFPL